MGAAVYMSLFAALDAAVMLLLLLVFIPPPSSKREAIVSLFVFQKIMAVLYISAAQVYFVVVDGWIVLRSQCNDVVAAVVVAATLR